MCDCKRTADGYTDIVILGHLGRIQITLKWCTICFEATPLNQRAAERIRGLSGDEMDALRALFAKRHPHYEIIL
jgi:hypothetical protein